MYVAFPRSEYYGSSDFSEPSQRPCVVDLVIGTLIGLDIDNRGVLSRSRPLTQLTSSHMPGSWTPPGLYCLAIAADTDIGFHVIKRVARTGILNISRLDRFTPLKAFRPV